MNPLRFILANFFIIPGEGYCPLNGAGCLIHLLKILIQGWCRIEILGERKIPVQGHYLIQDIMAGNSRQELKFPVCKAQGVFNLLSVADIRMRAHHPERFPCIIRLHYPSPGKDPEV